MPKPHSQIDDFVRLNEAWLTADMIRQLAVMNAMSHEVRPDGTAYVDDPDDPGGATNFGVSLRFLRAEIAAGRGDQDGDNILDYDLDGDGDVDAEDVKQITASQAGVIFERDFWFNAHIYLLPPRLAIKVFDMAINMGPRQAIKIFQRSLNHTIQGKKLVIDGVIGPKTVAAAEVAYRDGIATRLMGRVRADMLAFYQLLVQQTPAFSKFLTGWTRRASS